MDTTNLTVENIELKTRVVKLEQKQSQTDDDAKGITSNISDNTSNSDVAPEQIDNNLSSVNTSKLPDDLIIKLDKNLITEWELKQQLSIGKEDISKPRENDDEEPPKVDRETFCKAHKIF
ncbi:7829_t:CDS:2 [Entrophospora sp. SA101]|nr:7829_t:CDS:2 [Entrophospora sp. SA101]